MARAFAGHRAAVVCPFHLHIPASTIRLHPTHEQGGVGCLLASPPPHLGCGEGRRKVLQLRSQSLLVVACRRQHAFHLHQLAARGVGVRGDGDSTLSSQSSQRLRHSPLLRVACEVPRPVRWTSRCSDNVVQAKSTACKDKEGGSGAGSASEPATICQRGYLDLGSCA
jgi:hypothetical protein